MQFGRDTCGKVAFRKVLLGTSKNIIIDINKEIAGLGYYKTYKYFRINDADGNHYTRNAEKIRKELYWKIRGCFKIDTTH